MSNAEWMQRDLAHVWHPCSQMKDHEWLPLVPIERGKGAWLFDFEGRRYLDAISSWWVNLFGHGHPAIASRIAEQAGKLEHVLLAGATHSPVIELSERLTEITPPGLTRCFYADIGSAAVEVALKMSFHYWRNIGKSKKHRFVALGNGYHGETLGALGVGDVALYKEVYRPLLNEAIIAPSPDAYLAEPGESAAAFARRRFEDMERILAEQGDEIAAVILEPLVQCAGNMRMHHPVYLSLLREACDRYGVHLIADEIAVGFGRTGTLFACEQADISPDFLCLSKGITAGFLPLAVVMTTDTVYEAFYDEYRNIEKAFLHSHSYTGNPLACAAALATLDVFRDTDVIGENRERGQWIDEELAPLRDHPHVGDVRRTGMIAAVEMVRKQPREAYPWQERRGIAVYRYGLEHECWMRPLGNTVYWMLPYVVTREDVAHLGRVTRDAIDTVTRS